MDWDYLWMGLVTAIPVFGFYGPRLLAYIASLFTGQVVMMSEKPKQEDQ